jgi:dTDP-4-amino-4,6-dideoxygalactose transaminase
MKYLDLSEFLAVIEGVIKNNVGAFEKEFAEYMRVKYALGTSYGRTALYIALKAIDVDNKEVMVPAFTCSVVRDAICFAGAKPIFIDVNVDTLNTDISDIKKKLTEQTKVIIPTHYYGCPCGNLEQIIKFGRENNIIVLEDCAHSLGAEYKSKKVGSFGDVSIFSLTKNTLNFQGGIIVTNDKELYMKVKGILNKEGKRTFLQKCSDFYSILIYGYTSTVDKLVFDRINKSIFKWWLIKLPNILTALIKFLYCPIRKLRKQRREQIGFYQINRNNLEHLKEMNINVNLKMHPMVASIGRVQLRKIDKINNRRIKISKRINEKLNIGHFKNMESRNSKNVYAMLPMKFQNVNLDKIVGQCKKEGLLLRKTWPAFQDWWEEQDTINVRKVRDSLLMWDVNPMVTDKAIEKTLNVIKKVLEVADEG